MKTNLLVAIMVFAAATVFAAKPQTKSWVNKDARFFVKHYEQSNPGTRHIRENFEGGVNIKSDVTNNFIVNWDDGTGGKQTWNWTETISGTYANPPNTSTYKTANIWPASWWPNLLYGTFEDFPPGSTDGSVRKPNIILEHCDLKTKQDYSFAAIADDGISIYQGPYIEEGHLTGAPHTQIVLKFYSGGMGLPKRKSVYQATASGYSHKQTNVAGIYKSPLYDSIPIASQNITLGDLGQLDPDGILYANIDDGSTKDITPKVANTPYYTFGWPVLTKYTLISQVSCQALTDINMERTSLGVAEVVSLGTMPAETTWNTSAGTLSVGQGGHGSGTYLYAPHTAATATVTATIRKASLSIDFGVVEPSGIQATIRARQTDFALGSVGAGMYLNVVLQPTTVSFAALKVMEPSEPTIATGYFLAVDPSKISHVNHGADVPHSVGCNNLIYNPTQIYFDHAWSSGWNGPFGQGGSYTFPIHPIWWVDGDTSTHPLSGWTDQVMTLSPDGTMSVDKFGLNETRHP